jgi:hypothetical protein
MDGLSLKYLVINLAWQLPLPFWFKLFVKLTPDVFEVAPSLLGLLSI